MKKNRLFIVIAALWLCAFTQSPSPADLYGPLFQAVQTQRLFGDGKSFVDAVPKRPPEAIMADYRANPPADAAALRRFVLNNFTLPTDIATPANSPAGGAAPGPLLDHIATLWPHLTRPSETPPPGSSALALPAPYVVPGGRFREIYYWDSYFTMLGLVRDGRMDLVQSMVADFEHLLETYGRIPNGTRSYYLSRSQPPFFSLMVNLLPKGNEATQRHHLAALKREHDFWMSGSDCLAEQAHQPDACRRVVRLADGSLLNRYWDDRDSPRDESYAEDVETARQAPDRPAAEVYRHLRAAAESGWDFSSRWLDDPAKLSSIRTTDIIPVDLNSLLWQLERSIALRCALLEDRACADLFERQAAARQGAIIRHLWQPDEGRFADYDFRNARPAPVLSAATLFPLFAGLATPSQAEAVAALTERELLAPGGLRTTQIRNGQQWDAPNGWPPLQWVAVEGLARYGHRPLARDIAQRWIGTVDRTYRATGKLLEKYNVEERLPGGGGEYPLQDGFGWTNGVTRALIARYPELNPDR
ncbi:alpha,alpha-trehalase TreA [Niveispirillum sp. SYP-B3756]|uniref:alpha,alpha-trehalase TreA n=1 Tax=Niveispirillum sp. SYP-B3756 TaxID=2662178 RepID=UPI001B3BB63F